MTYYMKPKVSDEYFSSDLYYIISTKDYVQGKGIVVKMPSGRFVSLPDDFATIHRRDY